MFAVKNEREAHIVNDPGFLELIRAGYKPEQILSCWPCRCRQLCKPAQWCAFPTHRAGIPIKKATGST